MAIAFVQSANAYASSVAFSGNVTSGNFIVAIATSGNSLASATVTKADGTATISLLGSTSQGGAASPYYYIRTYWFSVTGTGSLTLQHDGGGDAGITIAEFSGVNLSDAYEAVLDVNGSSESDTADTGNITPAIADSLLIGGYVNGNEYGHAITADASWNTSNILGNSQDHQHYAQYDILTTATAQDWTIVTSGFSYLYRWSIQLVCFNGTAEASSTPSITKIMNYLRQMRGN